MSYETFPYILVDRREPHAWPDQSLAKCIKIELTENDTLWFLIHGWGHFYLNKIEALVVRKKSRWLLDRELLLSATEIVYKDKYLHLNYTL